ncbi:MAG: hypothetical protein K5945_05825 [Bacteroidaceae bacterium]|nr:hypothetical protein [Bacteroidaceae bacterium]
MKRNIKYGLLTLAVALGFASCSNNDYEYSPAELVDGAQVFFPLTNEASVNLTTASTSFTIPVQRTDSTEALSIGLKVEGDTKGIYTFPSTVSFAANQAKTNVTVGVDNTKLEYDSLQTITVTLDDEKNITPYGPSSYTFRVGAPSPLTPWVTNPTAFRNGGGIGEFPLGTMGTGTYSFAQYAEGDQEGIKVSMRQNTAMPNVVQFRVEGWGAGDDFYTDDGVEVILNGEWDADLGVYRITWPAISTGYYNSSYSEDVMVSDYVTYAAWRTANGATEDSGWPSVTWEKVPSYYDPVTGKFSLYVVYYISLGYFGAGYEYLQMDGFYVPDYSAAINFKGVLTDNAGQVYASADVELGVDAKNVRAIVMTQDDDASAVADALAAGELEGMEITGSGRIEVPFDAEELASEKLQLIVAVFEEGEVLTVSSERFEYYGGGNNPWQSLGTGSFTDDMILPLFGYAAEDYPVEIQENTETPGLYRLVKMYSAVAADFGVDSGTGDVLVHAEDPEAVYIPKQDLGLQLGNNGPFSISTDAGEYVEQYGLDAVKAQLPEIFATLKDGVITFPVLQEQGQDEKITNYQLWCILDGNYYYAGRAGAFKIVLPSATASVKAKVAEERRALNFEARLKGLQSKKNGMQVKSHLFKTQLHMDIVK